MVESLLPQMIGSEFSVSYHGDYLHVIKFYLYQMMLYFNLRFFEVTSHQLQQCQNVELILLRIKNIYLPVMRLLLFLSKMDRYATLWARKEKNTE